MELVDVQIKERYRFVTDYLLIVKKGTKIQKILRLA